MKRSSFIKHINHLDEEELREELLLLFSKLDDVKKFYALELGTDEERQKIYAKAKKIISSNVDSFIEIGPKKTLLNFLPRDFSGDKISITNSEEVNNYV